MTNVVAISDRYHGYENTESASDELREIAADIDAGRISARRGLIVWQTHDGFVRTLAFGQPVSKVEAVGLLTWASADMKN